MRQRRPHSNAGHVVGLALASRVHVNGDTLEIELHDGRSIAVPLEWYPGLAHGSSDERACWRLTGWCEGIHRPDLDEDIEVEHLLRGVPSGKSQTSFAR